MTGSDTYIHHTNDVFCQLQLLPCTHNLLILQYLGGKEKPSWPFSVDILYRSKGEIQAAMLEACQALTDQNKGSSGGGKEDTIPFQCSNLCCPDVMVLIQAHTTLSRLCSSSKRHSKRKQGESSGVPFLLSPTPRS